MVVCVKVKASTMIDKSLWAEIKKLATLSDKPAGEITEVGLKLLLIIAKTGVPDDLGALIQVHDPELLNTLRELYEAWRSAEAINLRLQ